MLLGTKVGLGSWHIGPMGTQLPQMGHPHFSDNVWEWALGKFVICEADTTGQTHTSLVKRLQIPRKLSSGEPQMRPNNKLCNTVATYGTNH